MKHQDVLKIISKELGILTKFLPFKEVQQELPKHCLKYKLDIEALKDMPDEYVQSEIVPAAGKVILGSLISKLKVRIGESIRGFCPEVKPELLPTTGTIIYGVGGEGSMFAKRFDTTVRWDEAYCTNPKQLDAPSNFKSVVGNNVWRFDDRIGYIKINNPVLQPTMESGGLYLSFNLPYDIEIVSPVNCQWSEITQDILAAV